MEFQDDTFIYWSVERDKIRAAREAGKPRDEWTQDPILKEFSFCNVSREDDRTTRWVKENVRDPYDQDGDSYQLFLAMCVCRFFNLPESLNLLVKEGILQAGKALDLHALHDCLQDYKDESTSHRVFAAAYMVGAPDNHRTYAFGFEKIAYVCGVLNDAVLPDECTRAPHHRKRQFFVEELNKQFGFAEFMSGQVAADLAYTHVLGQASDHYTWAPRGPGAMKGMNLTVGKPMNRNIPVDEYLSIGRAQMDALPADLKLDRDLHMHDVASNVNCETSKYLQLKLFGKKPKRKYKNWSNT